MNTTILNNLENHLLNMGYKIYNSKDNYLYKRVTDNTEEYVEVTSNLLIVGIKNKIDQHKSFYPLSQFLIDGIEELIKIESKQLGGTHNG